MRSRTTVTAALALAAATVLAVAACGSSVNGSAQVNTVAAETMTSSTSSTSSSATSAKTSSTSADDETSTGGLPTDLSELSSLLSELPTGLSVPTDLSLPTDLSIPTDFSDLTNLSIPGYNSDCLSVASAYASISLALLPAFLGGADNFNAGDLQSTLSSLTGNVPAELAPAIAALGEIATEANGKTLTEVAALLEGEKYTAADKTIRDWLDANCGG